MRAGLLTALAKRLKVIEGRCYKEMQPHDLTLEWAIRQWEESGGRCHYTKLPMRFGVGRHPLTMSFDRKDPSQGYVQCNVVLCCLSVNLFKSNMTPEQFAYILQQIIRNAPKGRALLPNPFKPDGEPPAHERRVKPRFDPKKWGRAYRKAKAT